MRALWKRQRLHAFILWSPPLLLSILKVIENYNKAVFIIIGSAVAVQHCVCMCVCVLSGGIKVLESQLEVGTENF